MRIHLNLPSAAPVASTSSNHALLSAAPSPLTALTPSGELILIELQGALEIENQSAAGGQILGTLSFEPTRPDRPVLMVSHHRLEGKFVNLVRPLAVLEKKVRPDKATPLAADGVLLELSNGKRRPEEQRVGTVRKARRVEGDKEAGVASSSPPPSPKRARDAMDFSSSPPRPTPTANVARATALPGIDENAEHSSLQHSSKEKEGEEEDVEEPQTAVYYDVVSVIKRKILFSKRPEPIVRLDPSASLTTA